MPDEKRSRTQEFLPDERDLASLGRAAARCRGCSLEALVSDLRVAANELARRRLT